VVTAPPVVTPPYVPPNGPVPIPPGQIVDGGFTQLEMDKLAIIMVGFTLPPPTTFDDIFDAEQLQLPSFGGGLDLFLTWTACTTSCLGSPGGTTRVALPLERASIAAAKNKSNVIATTSYSTPAGGTRLDYAAAAAQLNAEGKAMKSLAKVARSTTKVKAKLKHAPAAKRKAIKKQLSTLGRQRKAALRKLGVTPHRFTSTAAGRKLLAPLRKKLKAHKKASIVLRLTVTDPASKVTSTRSKTVRITG